MPRRLPAGPTGRRYASPPPSTTTRARHALAALTVGILGVGTAGSIVLTGHAQQTAESVPAPAVVTAAPEPADSIHAPVPRAFRTERASRSSFREALGTTANPATLSGALRPAVVRAAVAERVEKRAEKLDRQQTTTKRRAKVLRKEQREDEAQAKAAVLPVARYTVAARFGAVGSWSRYHTGFDFSTSIGTVVRAPAPGVVTHAGSGGPAGGWAGTYVTVLHADGTSSLYAHLSSASVHAGEQVTAGRTVGRVGMSGRSFGPHLHFEVYPKGVAPEDVYEAIDPAPWLRALGLNP